MPTFQYEALNSAGQTMTADMEAASQEEALARIRMQGCFPTRLREKAGPKPPATTARAEVRSTSILNRAIGRVSVKKIANFTRQFSTLQDAGLPILRSLKLLGRQQRPGMLKSILESVAASVEGGETLSQAMARHPRAFDRLYVNMVQAGESGGVLDVILQRLASFMEKAQRLRRRVIGALIYPSAVITFSVLIVTGIMMFVVPKFQEIFRDMRATLPALTIGLMNLSHFIAREYGWAVILGAPFLLLGLFRMVGKTGPGRMWLDRITLRVPVVGRIAARSAIARFARTLGTLLAAGVPILEALNIARDTVGNVVFARALQKVHDAIREGESFATPLRAANVCDELVTDMIDVGEETGDLDKMLLKIADNYDEEVDVLVSSLVSLLEPVMVLVLGGIVGTIVLALFLPLVILMQQNL